MDEIEPTKSQDRSDLGTDLLPPPQALGMH